MVNVNISQTGTYKASIRPTIANTGSLLLAFDWYIYIWPSSILKIKIKVNMQIFTVNILQTVTGQI